MLIMAWHLPLGSSPGVPIWSIMGIAEGRETLASYIGTVRSAECRMLYGRTLIFLENGPDLEEKIRLQEGLVRAVVRPDAEQARAVTVAKPVGDLLNGGLFEVVGEASWWLVDS